MYRGLNAGFGASLAGEFPSLEYFDVEMIRQDLQSHLLKGPAQLLIAEFQRTTIRPLFIVDQLDLLPLFPDGTWVELMNEPDLKMTPERYAKFVAEAHLMHGSRLRLFTGAISNISERPLTFLRTVLKTCPYVRNVSVHRYPEGVSFTEPHHGFSSRDDEVHVLFDVIGDRPFIVSEFGYHQAKRGWWIFSRRLSDYDQRFRVMQEFTFWRNHGAEAAFLYQLNDGPEDQPIARYGIRDRWGVWKPSALAFGAPWKVGTLPPAGLLR